MGKSVGRKDKKIHQVSNRAYTPVFKRESLFRTIFTFRNLLVFTLLVFNLIVFTKLNFFFPLISGASHLLDFDDYYHLVHDLINHINPYGVSYMTSWGPPPVFLYFLPFSFFKLSVARSLTTLINIAAGFLTCYVLSKKLFGRSLIPFLILIFIFFSSFPARFSLEMGQPNLLIALFISIILTTKSSNIKAFFLSLVISLKTFYALALLPIFKRQPKTAIKTVVVLIFLLASTLPIFSLGINKYYASKTLPLLFSGATNLKTLEYYNQSTLALLSRTGIHIATNNIYFVVLLLAVIIILVSGSVEIAIIYSVIFSIISWQHYYAALFPVYVLVFTKTPKKMLHVFYFLILLFFWWVEFPWLHNASKTLLNGILASHYFISGFLLSFLIIGKEKHDPKKSLTKPTSVL